MMQALVVSGANNFFDAELSSGALVRASLKGKKLNDEDGKFYNPLSPGDIVLIEQDKINDGEGQITERLPRKNFFARLNEKRNLPQVLAANIDFLLIVDALKNPPFHPRFIDRVLMQAEYNALHAVIVLNKCDLKLSQKENEERERYAQIYKNAGYPVIEVSAQTGAGFAELENIIAHNVAAFVGRSGVGKSSIINRLCPDGIEQKTGLVSHKYDRGIHTTTQGVLLHAKNGGTLIDTPGVRRFENYGIAPEDCALYFREMKDFVGKCSFGISCTHTHENGCAILEAVTSGSISAERYDSMARLLEHSS
ncbi:MAG: ribosome small subunit-dependent GTPase A [Treponemataceae bacterium]|nr:MAG: ribosome small subunit-dependent GTPase A [Treponemataceae bacterium]